MDLSNFLRFIDENKVAFAGLATIGINTIYYVYGGLQEYRQKRHEETNGYYSRNKGIIGALHGEH